MATRLSKVIEWFIIGALLFTLAVLPLEPFSSSFSIGMLVLALLLWGVDAVVKKRVVIVLGPLHLVLLAFLGVVLLQLLPWPFSVHRLNMDHSFEGLPAALDQWNTISLDKTTTRAAAGVLASLIGYCFVVAGVIDSEKKLYRFINGLILLGGALSLLCILDVVSPPEDPLLKGGGNALGLYYYSLHRLAGYIEMMFPLPLAMLLAGAAQGGRWVWYGFAAVAIGVAIALAESTGAVFVLAVELMALLFFVVKGRSAVRASGHRGFDRVWTAAGVAVIVCTIAGGVVWLSTRSLSQMVAADVNNQMMEVSALHDDAISSGHYGRIEIWKETLRMLVEHPMGVGFGVHPIAYAGYDPSPGLKFVNAAHNDYLQVLSETGVIGGGLVALFLVFLFRLSRRVLQTASPLGRGVALGATVGLVGILVHSLIDFHLQMPGTAMLFFVLTALLVSVERLGSVRRSTDVI